MNDWNSSNEEEEKRRRNKWGKFTLKKDRINDRALKHNFNDIICTYDFCKITIFSSLFTSEPVKFCVDY